MKKLLLSLFFIITYSVSAQEYNWQWATRGGGIKKSPSEGTDSFAYNNSEQIKDIVVDADNNYYFLAYITQQSTEYDGLPIQVYNESIAPAGADLLLISTSCDGTLRWTQTVGGGGYDFGYKISLDTNGGLYLTANVKNLSGPSQPYLPPHFSAEVALPQLDGTGQLQEGYKTAALLKYNTADGSLAWYKMLQGDVNLSNSGSLMAPLLVDDDGNIRLLVGLAYGTHLEGQVTVPETFTNTAKFFIVTVSPEGEYLDILDLPMEGIIEQSQVQFNYDEILGRYYISGHRTYPGNSTLIPLSYGGTAFEKCSFILAIDEEGNEIWRLEENMSLNANTTRIFDFALDEDSSFYISGIYNNNGGAVTTFSNYTLPPTPGMVAFVLKMSHDGLVTWGSAPDTETSLNFPYDIAINGDEIAVATEMFQGTWDEVSINRGQNYLTDPVILRINKETGVAFALHDVMGNFGNKDSFTAIATDNDGNYIAGGYQRNQLFTAEDDGIETLTKVGGITSYTDFFIAKLAAVPCGTNAGIEGHSLNNIKVYPNPTNGFIYLQTDEIVNNFEVMNLLGQVVKSGDVKKSQNSIQLEELKSGTYLLKLYTADGKVISQKIIKE